jgi:uncharacterized membrane protein
MNHPFIYQDEDENDHYYPEAIIVFFAFILYGCMIGGAISLLIWSLVTGTVF